MFRKFLYLSDKTRNEHLSQSTKQSAIWSNMNRLITLQSDTNGSNERLASRFYSSRRYNPTFLAVAGLGFIAIFLLTQFGFLGDPAPQLLYIGSITLLFAIVEIPALALAKQKKGFAAMLFGSIMTGIFAVLLTLLWQGIVPITLLIVFATQLIAFRSDMPPRNI